MDNDKTLRVGVISCSGMAESHMKAVKDDPRGRLLAVCDIDGEKARAVAARMGVDRVFTDYRELLAQPDIDAVILVTPDQLHRSMTEDAIRAGKHVLCEKPLALTREDCAAIVAASRGSGKKFMVGQICRYTPGFVKAKELIDKGAIGELYYVESEYAHDYSGFLKPGNWRWDPVRNGVVGGGCHAVDLLRWVAGNPTEVTAYANHKMLPGLPVDDCTIAILRFPNQVIGKVFVSIGCKRDYTMRSAFYGTRGTIITDNTNPYLTVYQSGVGEGNDLFEGAHDFETPIRIPIGVSNHNTFGEFNEFCGVVLDDRPVRTTAGEGAATIEACLAIVRSANEGRTVRPDYSFLD